MTNALTTRVPRRLAQSMLDLFVALSAWAFAYLVRFNLDLLAAAPFFNPRAVVIYSLVQVAALAVVGNYSRLWRYTSLADLWLLVAGIGLGALATLALAIAGGAELFTPRSVLLSQPVFFFLLAGTLRVARRWWREKGNRRAARSPGEPVIVIGAGDAAVALVSEFVRGNRWRAVALLDDDPVKQQAVIQGVRVLGPIADFAKVANRLGVNAAVIAIPTLSPRERQQLARELSEQGAVLYTMPPLEAIRRGAAAEGAVRRVRPEELLRRAPVELDRELLRAAVDGQVVMVTGAGGSIGAELCRQLADLRPKRMVLFDLNEFRLYLIAEELREGWKQRDVVTAIGDVKNEARLAHIMAAYRPNLVFHAAAYKHVPMMEEVNAFEAVRNNALGSQAVARCAVAHRVERLVIVSTDKAVNPTNVMGATKRLAELLVQEATAGSAVRTSIVRFGNVLGSAGSVIPKFVEQIRRGGPVTVTDPEMTRYFMSIPEAAQLVILSSSIGAGGEIFVLDMGAPVKIVDLARDLIRVMGKSESDIDIVFTGLRPGEKLYEELLFEKEQTRPTRHERIRIAGVAHDGAPVAPRFADWLAENPMRDDAAVRAFLQQVVPEYRPDARFAEPFDDTFVDDQTRPLRLDAQ